MTNTNSLSLIPPSSSRHRCTAAAAAGLALLAAAGTASAQCSWFVYDVPDLDQRRLTLPNDGGMYCAPTSALNWFAYYANNGFPQNDGLSGPRDWEDNANYGLVTQHLEIMGALMGTHPTGGTKGGLEYGAKMYALSLTDGDIVVSGSGVWGGGWVPTPDRMNAAHALGCQIQVAYGRYTDTDGGTRDGGHVISVNGLMSCPPVMSFRDPAFDGPADNAQSDFRTSMAALTPVTGLFRPKSNYQWLPLQLYRMDISRGTRQFLDSMHLYAPASALTLPVGLDANELRVIRPKRPTGFPFGEIKSYNKAPGAGAVVDLVMAPDGLAYYYACGVGTPEKPNVWKLDPVTGVSTHALAGAPFNPHALAISRFRDLYTLEGMNLRRYLLTSGPATFVDDITFSVTPEAIAYDDATDRIITLTAKAGIGLRRVYAYGRTLPAFGVVRDLGVALDGKVCIVPDPEDGDAFWVCGDETPKLYRVKYDAGTGKLEPVTTFTYVAGTVLSGLNVSDGNTVIYSVNGELVERIKNQQGTWVHRPDSRWAGRQVGGRFNLARSRSSFDADIQNDPAFDNLTAKDIVEYPSYGDCYADCDGDGELSINDFICFQTLFAIGDLTSDCDFNGKKEIDDFICFQTAFAVGC